MISTIQNTCGNSSKRRCLQRKEPATQGTIMILPPIALPPSAPHPRLQLLIHQIHKLIRMDYHIIIITAFCYSEVDHKYKEAIYYRWWSSPSNTIHQDYDHKIADMTVTPKTLWGTKMWDSYEDIFVKTKLNTLPLSSYKYSDSTFYRPHLNHLHHYLWQQWNKHQKYSKCPKFEVPRVYPWPPD